MCGIAGVLRFGDRHHDDHAALCRMLDRIRHRGPDGEGIWASSDDTVFLGHTRLAIQDLSKFGAQPMQSSSNRFVISFNGEVYNFPDLMVQLKGLGHSFRGHSDTEVILASIEQWGLEIAVSKFVGMFAFALWDRSEKTLNLVRDRLGIKPLYYRTTATSFVFASELKAIREFDAASLSVDRNVLASYLRYSYVPAPYTIYSDTHKLPPASILTIRLDGASKPVEETHSYWRFEDYAADSKVRFGGDYDEALDHLQILLEDSVSGRTISDVPLGAFLSGGVDSSLVAALMQHGSSTRAKTFTIGFSEDGYNEAPWAKKVAAHLHTDHTELYVSPEDARSIIPDIASIYDEPFADSSQIPSILVSRLARENVTVCLSGDGGDELFSGYQRYDLGTAVWRSIGWMPASLRHGLSRLSVGLSAQRFQALDRLLDSTFRRFGRAGSASDKLQKAAVLLRSGDREQVYQHIVSHWKEPVNLVRGAVIESPSILGDPPDWLKDLQLFDYMMAADVCTYLPDDILTKVDRASMSCGLEVRVPILDHRVVEFAFSLPLGFKRKGGLPKSILRDLLARFVPTELIDRPKMGFGVPIDMWLRGPLREWASDLLSDERLRRDGYFNPELIRSKWQEHLSGERNWSAYLWDILMFQSWLETQYSGS